MIKDHRFGVLSLSWECCQEAVQPDYSKSFAEICELALQHEVAWHHDRGTPHEARMDLLQALGFPRQSMSLKQHPASELFQIPWGIVGHIIWIYEPSQTDDLSINPLHHIDQKQLLSLLEAINNKIESLDYVSGTSIQLRNLP
jgi:hypothetical protein